MAHVRQQIRDAIAFALAGGALLKSNVYSSRVYPLEKIKLPAALIFTEDENSEAEVMGVDPILVRVAVVSVQAIAAVTAALDANLDDLAAEIEAAIAADRHLGGIAVDAEIKRTTTTLEAVGDTPAGRITLDFEVTYRTKASDPATPV